MKRRTNTGRKDRRGTWDVNLKKRIAYMFLVGKYERKTIIRRGSSRMEDNLIKVPKGNSILECTGFMCIMIGTGCGIL
jgi:hypothetical protein